MQDYEEELIDTRHEDYDDDEESLDDGFEL